MLNKSSKVIENLFSKCQENYYKRNSNMMIEGKWNIKINLFNHLFLKKNGAICNKKSNFTKSFIIKGNKKFNSKSISLTCYLDQQLFYNLMSRGSPWNTALTGSIILFYRKSKIYNPTLENSLNFFTI